eukprot:5418854-Pyramimonas_sp.AAC.1
MPRRVSPLGLRLSPCPRVGPPSSSTRPPRLDVAPLASVAPSSPSLRARREALSGHVRQTLQASRS